MVKKIWVILLALAIVWPLASARAQNPATTIHVDANLNPHPISPLIYGLAFADTAAMNDLNVPLNRSGGNATTRYNWQPTPAIAPVIGTLKASLPAAARRARTAIPSSPMPKRRASSRW